MAPWLSTTFARSKGAQGVPAGAPLRHTEARSPTVPRPREPRSPDVGDPAAWGVCYGSGGAECGLEATRPGLSDRAFLANGPGQVTLPLRAGLAFLTFEMEVLIAPTCEVLVRIRRVTVQKGLRILPATS